MSPAGLEPAVPANELPQTEFLDRATAEIGYNSLKNLKKKLRNEMGLGECSSLKLSHFTSVFVPHEL
jgi:hypothetical protein